MTKEEVIQITEMCESATSCNLMDQIIQMRYLLTDKLPACLAEINRLQMLLNGAVRRMAHLEHCRSRYITRETCNCGYDQFLAEVRG